MSLWFMIYSSINLDPGCLRQELIQAVPAQSKVVEQLTSTVFSNLDNFIRGIAFRTSLKKVYKGFTEFSRGRALVHYLKEANPSDLAFSKNTPAVFIKLAAPYRGF